MVNQNNPAESCSKKLTDRISNLPSDVRGQILSRLTIKEAVKTSVLSSKWQFNSAMLPHLVFDNQCLSTQDHTTIENIVDQVLLLHVGPIHKFKLSHPHLLKTSAIDRWIRYLSRNAIKEFILEIWKGDPHKMPSCLFSCQDMVHLELHNCSLKPPSTCKGFRSLKNLCISEVTVAQDVFDNLIVSCPLLESVTLIKCYGFTRLKIDAPNLQSFHFEGFFEHVDLKNTLNLAEVCINLDDEEDDRSWDTANCSNLVKFFVHLPRIRRLTIQNWFLEYLALGALPAKLPELCLYLNFLSILIFFIDLDEVSTFQCLLRSSPALQELEIKTSAYHNNLAPVEEVNSLSDDDWNCPFTRLRLVKITGISGVKAELDFLKFLLLNSPVLERLTVIPAASVDSSKLLKKLIRFRRSSVHAEIIYLDP